MTSPKKVPLKEGAEKRSYYKYYLREMTPIPGINRNF